VASINRSWWRLLYVICSCWKLTDAFLMSLAASAVAPNLRSISFCFVHFCSASITDRGFEAIVKCCKGLERVCSWRIACCTWHLARHNIQACRCSLYVRLRSDSNIGSGSSKYTAHYCNGLYPLWQRPYEHSVVVR
jgi:hypothetical protein